MTDLILPRRQFLAGLAAAMAAPAIVRAASLMPVRSLFGGASYHWDGAIDEFRVTKGLCNWTISFWTTPGGQITAWQHVCETGTADEINDRVSRYRLHIDRDTSTAWIPESE